MEKRKEVAGVASFKEANISLILDSYEDIFSSFDARRHSEKALSTDFLDEAKRASRDKDSGSIELKLLIPKNKRQLGEEIIIKKRLKRHFQHHYNMVLD